jgi:glutamate synthase domain-containing protein 3
MNIKQPQYPACAFHWLHKFAVFNKETNKLVEGHYTKTEAEYAKNILNNWEIKYGRKAVYEIKEITKEEYDWIKQIRRDYE